MPPIMQRAADRRAAGDADAARDHRVRADAHVVPDLHLVVDLDAVVDDGVVDRAAIDRRVRADLDVVADPHAAELRHLDVAVDVGREAEAVGADDDARDATMQRSPMRTPRHERDARDAGA